MDNFQLNEFNFDFDFQRDFTADENQIIDEMMANPVEGMFEADSSLVGNRPASSSIFDYLYDDSSAMSDVQSLDHLSKNHLITFNDGLQQSSGSDFVNFIETDDDVANQNVNFDWTAFLDKSPSIRDNFLDQSIISTEPVQSDLIRAANVTNDNGFVYQELKTLDVPQMYANLDKKFGLLHLKNVDERMDYSALPNEHQLIGQNDRYIIKSNSSSMKQKLFLLPLHLNHHETEALQHVDANLRKSPLVLNSMLNKCNYKEANTKILLQNRPKQTKQKSERYLTVDEQMEQIKEKEIVLPVISWKPQRQRKEEPKFDKENVRVAHEVFLENFNITIKKSVQSNGKKTTGPKRLRPSIQHHQYSEPMKLKMGRTQTNDQIKRIKYALILFRQTQ